MLPVDGKLFISTTLNKRVFIEIWFNYIFTLSMGGGGWDTNWIARSNPIFDKSNPRFEKSKTAIGNPSPLLGHR